MENGDKPIRAETRSWLTSQLDDLMMDPDLLAAMPLEEVYEALDETEADVKPPLETLLKRPDPGQGLSSGRPPPSRPRLSVIRSLRPQMWQGWAVAASFMLFTLYGTLWLVGRTTVPDTYALADIAEHTEVLNGSVRGTDTPGDLAQGAESLLAAPPRLLGLFPHYDQAQVARAITHLEQAFQASDSTDSFLRERTAFFLGKAYLMQGNVAAARNWLETARAQNATGYQEETQALLRALDTP